MDYKAIIKQAYNVTLNNPLMWVFGLFLSAGFNLNVLYLSSLFTNKSNWVSHTFIELLRSQPLITSTTSLALLGVMFVISNWAKTFFITESHRLVHKVENKVCPLCVGQHNQRTLWQRAPKGYSVIKIMIASAITIVLTLLVMAPVSQQGDSAPGLLGIVFIASLIITAGVSCWNIFTAFFILLHGKQFVPASKLSLDLITLRAKEVLEFIFLLLVIYGLAVVVGSVLILLSRYSLSILFSSFPQWIVLPGGINTMIQILAMVAFWVWLALTNVFFNLCLLIFFNQIVKPISTEEKIGVPGAVPS